MRHFLFPGFGLALAWAALSPAFSHLSGGPVPSASAPAPILSGPPCLLPRLAALQQRAQEHGREVDDILDQISAAPKPRG